MLNVIFAEGLADEDAIAAQSTGVAALRTAAQAVSPDLAEERWGAATGWCRSGNG